MNLLYFILSFFLQMWPFRHAPQKALSSRSRKPGRNRDANQDMMIWLPIVGWISLVVLHRPNSAWLKLLIVEIRLSNRPDDPDREPGLEYYSRLRRKQNRE